MVLSAIGIRGFLRLKPIPTPPSSVDASPVAQRLFRGEHTANPDASSLEKQAIPATTGCVRKAEDSGGGTLEIHGNIDDETGGSVNPILTLTAETCLNALRSMDSKALTAYRAALLAQGNSALALLEALLGDGSPDAERFAIEVLARIQTPETLTLAISHMLTRPAFTDNNWNRLARIVGGALDAATVDLVARLLHEATADGRRRMLNLLANVRTEEALFQLLVAAGEIEQDELNDVTMKALFYDGKRESMELLKDLMLTHEDSAVAALAAAGLAKRGTPDETRFLADLGNGDNALTQIALQALQQIRNSHSQNALIDIAGSGAYSRAVRYSAIAALGNSGSSDNVQRALRNLTITSDDPEIRIIARNQLDQIQPSTTAASTNNTETWF
jgi:hypothetical protein